MSIFRTNVPIFFSQKEEVLFQNYLLKKNINYYTFFRKNILLACGGYAFNKKTKTIDFTWGMVNSAFHNKGFGTNLVNYRIRNIIIEFPKINITLQTTQKTFKFYKKFGFQVEKITKNHYDIGLDKYEMKKYV